LVAFATSIAISAIFSVACFLLALDHRQNPGLLGGSCPPLSAHAADGKGKNIESRDI
jgi:hypothetical protein